MTLATDYATLQTAATRWSGGSSDTNYPEIVRDSIKLAEFDMDRELWVEERVKRLTASYTAEYEALPDDCARLKNLKALVDGEERQLDQEPAEAMAGLADLYRGPPQWYALVGAQVQLAPKPTLAAPMSARITYYGFIPRLSDASSCTAILLTYGNIYLWKTLEHLAAFTDDVGTGAKWAGKAAAAIAAANRAAIMRDATLA